MNPTEPPAPPPRPFAQRLVRAWGLPLVLGTALALLLLFFMNPSNGSSALDPPKPSPIDGDRAFGYLKALCAFGPRKAGSAANAKQREFVAAHFEKLGAKLTEQKFKGKDELTGQKVEMVNLVASWFPDRAERVVIAAHYDTRPFPDRDPDPSNWSSNYNPQKPGKPFLGANDGASGVALLMEIANHLNASPTPWGVDLVLFDGEELVYEDANSPRRGKYFLGSLEFARLYKAHLKKKGGSRYVAGIVLDMVADKEADIPVEAGSHRLAQKLTREIWGIADRLNSRAFVQNLGQEVLDDHLAMNDAHIPTVDIIDFDYPYWHTADDLPENCSGETMADVGRVVTAWLNQPKPAKGRKR